MIEKLKRWKTGIVDVLWDGKRAVETKQDVVSESEPVVQLTELETYKKLSEALNEEVLKLRATSLLKDEMYLAKYIENDNFKNSVIATLGGIALAHGGQYSLSYNFTNAVGNSDKKVSVTYDDEGMNIVLVDKEPEEKGE